MNLTIAPRVSPLSKIVIDPATGLHAFVFNDQTGAGNHVLLWRISETPRVLDLPNAGNHAQSASFGDGNLFVVAGDIAKGFGPFRITRWSLTNWQTATALTKKDSFVFGTPDTQGAVLVSAGLSHICIAFRKKVPVQNIELAWHNGAEWATRWDTFQPTNSSVDAFSFGAIQGADGLVYVFQKQDGNDQGLLVRYRLPSMEQNDVDQHYLLSTDGETGMHGELPTFLAVADPVTNELLFSYQKAGFRMITRPEGNLFISRSNLTYFKRDLSKSLFYADTDWMERTSPGIPVFVITDSIAATESIYVLLFLYRNPDAGDFTRRWVLKRVKRFDKSVTTVREIEIADVRFCAWADDGSFIYRPGASGTPFVLENILPIPVPVSEPEPDHGIDPTLRPTLTITTDKTVYQSLDSMIVTFSTAPNAEINAVIWPSNQKKPNVERRIQIDQLVDSDGQLKVKVQIKKTWIGPITIEGDATKDAYTSEAAKVVVQIV